MEWSGGADANLGVAEGNGWKWKVGLGRQSTLGRCLETTQTTSSRARVVFFKKKLKTETRLYRPFLSLENGKKGSVGEYIFCHLPSVKSRNTLQFEALLRFDFFRKNFIATKPSCQLTAIACVPDETGP